MEEMLMVYVTNPSKEKAQELATHLLNKRLVAYANIIIGDSMCWWDGVIEKEAEYILILKTVKENFDSVKNEVMDMSDYQVPCIIKIPVKANQQYVQWLRSEIKI